ncbi:hypothetical protein GCM10010222_11740 [Streptomyces tanashiensis]|nr:hypothetical protein GCM10010222_11740 [Streptomyces tanashiensis]
MLWGELEPIGRLDPAELFIREPWGYLTAVRLSQPPRGLRTQPSAISVDHSGTVHTLLARHRHFSNPDRGLQVIAGQPLGRC